MKAIYLILAVFGVSLHAREPASPAATPLAQPRANAGTIDEQSLAQEENSLAVEKRTGSDWIIHWELQVLALPASKALALLPELHDENAIEAGWAKLRQMGENDQVDVVADNGGQVASAGTMTFSHGEELKYGVEFDAPRMMKAAKTTARGGVETKLRESSEAVGVSFAPSIFFSRRLGIRLNLTARATDDGNRLEVTTRFLRTWLANWDETEVGGLPKNERILVKQPRFVVVNKVGTSGVFAGERILLNAHRVPGEEGKMELAFLRVWTTPRKSPAKK